MNKMSASVSWVYSSHITADKQSLLQFYNLYFLNLNHICYTVLEIAILRLHTNTWIKYVNRTVFIRTSVEVTYNATFIVKIFATQDLSKLSECGITVSINIRHGSFMQVNVL